MSGSDFQGFRLAKSWAHTNTNSKTGRHKRLNGYQVVRDDGKRVIVNAENESRPSRAIDQPKEMLLARRELRLEVASRTCGRIVSTAVDDNAVRSSEICRCLLIRIRNERCLVDVVLDKDWSQVDVPICTVWSVNNEWTDRALSFCEYCGLV